MSVLPRLSLCGASPPRSAMHQQQQSQTHLPTLHLASHNEHNHHHHHHHSSTSTLAIPVSSSSSCSCPSPHDLPLFPSISSSMPLSHSHMPSHHSSLSASKTSSQSNTSTHSLAHTPKSIPSHHACSSSKPLTPLLLYSDSSLELAHDEIVLPDSAVKQETRANPAALCKSPVHAVPIPRPLTVESVSSPDDQVVDGGTFDLVVIERQGKEFDDEQPNHKKTKRQSVSHIFSQMSGHHAIRSSHFSPSHGCSSGSSSNFPSPHDSQHASGNATPSYTSIFNDQTHMNPYQNYYTSSSCKDRARRLEGVSMRRKYSLQPPLPQQPVASLSLSCTPNPPSAVRRASVSIINNQAAEHAHTPISSASSSSAAPGSTHTYVHRMLSQNRASISKPQSPRHNAALNAHAHHHRSYAISNTSSSRASITISSFASLFTDSRECKASTSSSQGSKAIDYSSIEKKFKYFKPGHDDIEKEKEREKERFIEQELQHQKEKELPISHPIEIASPPQPTPAMSVEKQYLMKKLQENERLKHMENKLSSSNMNIAQPPSVSISRAVSLPVHGVLPALHKSSTVDSSKQSDIPISIVLECMASFTAQSSALLYPSSLSPYTLPLFPTVFALSHALLLRFHSTSHPDATEATLDMRDVVNVRLESEQKSTAFYIILTMRNNYQLCLVFPHISHAQFFYVCFRQLLSHVQHHHNVHSIHNMGVDSTPHQTFKRLVEEWHAASTGGAHSSSSSVASPPAAVVELLTRPLSLPASVMSNRPQAARPCTPRPAAASTHKHTPVITLMANNQQLMKLWQLLTIEQKEKQSIESWKQSEISSLTKLKEAELLKNRELKAQLAALEAHDTPSLDVAASLASIPDASSSTLPCCTPSSLPAASMLQLPVKQPGDVRQQSSKQHTHNNKTHRRYHSDITSYHSQFITRVIN